MEQGHVKGAKLYLNSTINFGIPPVLVFQLEVSYKVDRLLTGLTQGLVKGAKLCLNPYFFGWLEK